LKLAIKKISEENLNLNWCWQESLYYQLDFIGTLYHLCFLLLVDSILHVQLMQ
jgi:hypothetical protein